jgi:metal-responsive CopG/Arc/MetJ family transcriptional regulator
MNHVAKARVTISVARDVLATVDAHAGARGRSAYVEELLRQALIERAWSDYAAVITTEERAELRAAAAESEPATSAYLGADEAGALPSRP